MRAIVFMLHGCPVGWLGAYGNEWVATEHLDRLAAEGVVFDRHYSDCPEPAAARQALAGNNAELLESLKTKGIHSIIVRANRPENDAPDWFYAGWGEVFDARPREDDHSPLDALLTSFPPLLDRLADVPDYLLWIEIDRLLPPWEVPIEVFKAYLSEEAEESDPKKPAEDVDEDEEESESQIEQLDEVSPEDSDDSAAPWSDPPTGLFDPADPDAVEWLSYSFAAVVSRFDAELGFLFDALRERAIDRNATWFVTSDYGLPLGEHGQIGLFRPWLYEELVHLPLIVRLPGAEESCRRVGGLTQPPDLRATLLELFGLPATGSGKCLMPQCRGHAESERSIAITSLELGGAAERAIRTAEWVLLLPTRSPGGESRAPKMFVKPDDRCEMNDVYDHNLERAEELQQLLDTTQAE